MEHIRPPAILNGSPSFDHDLLVGRPNVGDRQRLMDRLNDVLDRRWLTNHGMCVRELERRLEAMLGVRHCVAVCNATLGLQLAAHAMNLKGEVIVPSFTFIATAHALSWIGLTPVFADVDPETCTIDPRSVESLITPRVSAILGVHVFGRACDVDALSAIASRHQLQLFFDAAHAFRSTYKGELIGSFGRCEVFSFHATKFFNSLEGGAITTNDDALAERLRSMRDFGYGPGHDNTISVGTNAKMNEFCGAMGLTSLESLDEFIATNIGHYETYRTHLAGVPGIEVLEYDAHEQNNYQYVVVKVDGAQAGLTRDELRTALLAERVFTRPYFHPCLHQMGPYSASYRGPSLPASERLSSQVLAFPTGTGVTPEEIKTICEVVRALLAHGPAVRECLHSSAVEKAGRPSPAAAPAPVRVAVPVPAVAGLQSAQVLTSFLASAGLIN
jgi:dTDP-4-amino-4,6-dideoxygalactose transaminase